MAADGALIAPDDRINGKPPGYKFGRPAVYRPALCDRVIELGKLGYSRARMAADIGVSKATITDWCKQHPDFSNAISIAMTHCQANWETDGHSNIDNRNFNTGLYLGMMKSMFRDDYGDKHEHTGADGKPLIPEAPDDAAIARRVAFMLLRADPNIIEADVDPAG